MAETLQIPVATEPDALELKLPSHTLRGVLTRLDLQLDRFEREAHVQLDDNGRLTLWYLRRSTRRLAELTTAALHRALAERAASKPPHVPVDVRAVAQDVIKALLPDARARQMELTLSATTPALLDSDPELLQLALHSLLVHALKAPASGNVRLEVCSDHNGVRATLHMPWPAPGGGPDLELCARAAALLDGRLQSDPHSGTFVLCLRRAHAAARFRSERPAVERTVAPLLLLVEDDCEIRDELAEVLRQDGYEVDAVADAAAARRSLKAAMLPDLILLDLRLPGMDGWQFRDSQLDDVRLAAIPVCLLSGDGDVKLTAQDLGAAGYLSKPFQVPELLDTVRGLVRRG